MDMTRRWGAALRASLLLSAVSLAAGASDVRLADAVMRADTQAIRALLEQEIDVNAAQADGTTALHWAVRHDDLDTANLLLSMLDKGGVHQESFGDSTGKLEI